MGEELSKVLEFMTNGLAECKDQVEYERLRKLVDSLQINHPVLPLPTQSPSKKPKVKGELEDASSDYYFNENLWNFESELGGENDGEKEEDDEQEDTKDLMKMKLDPEKCFQCGEKLKENTPLCPHVQELLKVTGPKYFHSVFEDEGNDSKSRHHICKLCGKKLTEN